jgi:cytochrome P450
MTIHATTLKLDDTNAPLPPLVPGLPLIGNALKLRGDMADFLVQTYHQLGPIYRIKVLNRKFTIMAGLEANQFLAKLGGEMLSSQNFFGGFGREMNDGVFLPSMEGDEHIHLRKTLRPGYAREAISTHYPTLIEIARAHTQQWQLGRRVPVVNAMQHLITDQLGIVLGGRAVGEYFDDVRDFLRTVVNVTMLKTAPGIMLKMPRYQRARERVFEFLRDLIADHRANPRGGDLVDMAIAAKDASGQRVSEDDMIAIGIGAYVAGMDTLANTVSFMLYALLTHPDAMARVTAEVDDVFANGGLTPQSLRGMKALHGAAVETLRMYMIAPITMRTALRTFEFGGCRVEAGTDIMIANGVTHFMPEFYPEPYRFDIDREMPKVANVYTPYSLGAHTCLGAGMAESLLMLTTATILHAAQLEIDPPGHTAKIISTPAPNPGKGFGMRVVAYRH